MSRRAALARISVLMATVFVEMVGFLVVLPLLPFYATRLGGDALAVGLMVSAFALAQLATAPLWGRLSDRAGRRPTILGGLVVSVAAHLLFALACSERAAAALAPQGLLGILFLSRLVQGAGSGTTGVVQAYVSDSVPPTERAKALGWLTAAASAGVMLGPLVGSLAATLGPAVPGLVAAGLCLANAAFGFRYLAEPAGEGASPASGAAAPRHPVRRMMAAVVAHPLRPASALILIYAFGMMAFMAMNAVLALFLQARFGVTERSIGWFYTYVGGVSLVMRSLVLGPAIERVGEHRVLRLGLVSLALGFALLPLAPGLPALALVVLLVPVGTALLFPVTTSLVSRVAAPGEVGQTMGVQQAFGGIARMLGPMWAGAAFQHLSPGAPFWISAALALLLLPYAARFARGAETTDATAPKPV
ncbi:MAG TPA: MFS transporter [Thermoanaerobaculia bacterium]|nr:MFS transporter [Thermoanaerobaculia bacterium]